MAPGLPSERFGYILYSYSFFIIFFPSFKVNVAYDLYN